MRVRIDLAYDGTAFHGWARQNGQRTVQGELEALLCKVLRLDEITVTVAGRTDAGVHATGQVCHVDIGDEILSSVVGHMTDKTAVEALYARLSRMVPDDIAIYAVSEAPQGFDARFSALDRMYVYRVADKFTRIDPRLRAMALRVDHELDLQAMNDAMSYAIGLHDFGSFAIPNPGGTTIREVKYASWQRVPSIDLHIGGHYDGRLDDHHHQAVGVSETKERADEFYRVHTLDSALVTFTIVADAFARNMVRSLVGASIFVGTGKRSVEWFADKIANPAREGFTGPAPALGLTLERVNYPQDSLLAVRADAIRSKRTLGGKED